MEIGFHRVGYGARFSPRPGFKTEGNMIRIGVGCAFCCNSDKEPLGNILLVVILHEQLAIPRHKGLPQFCNMASLGLHILPQGLVYSC